MWAIPATTQYGENISTTKSKSPGKRLVKEGGRFIFLGNEEDWPLRGASCFGKPPPPNSGQMLNPDVSAEHARSTLIY